MRDDTRRRLERTLLLQKLRWGGLGLAAAALVGGVFWLQSLDAATEVRKVAGVVEQVVLLPAKAATPQTRGYHEVDVKLADGRLARLVVADNELPKVGAQVEISDHVHGTGRHTFSWK